MKAIQRLNYFTSQFLVEDDFQDEQAYHRHMRLLHNKSLHRAGVVNGLEVIQAGTNQIKVTAGMAIDQEGEEIVLLNDSEAVPLSGNNTDVFVSLQYAETLDIPDNSSGVTGQFRRITEKFQINSSPNQLDGAVQLARVSIDSSGNIKQINNQERVWAGAAIAPKSIGTDQLADKSITSAKMAAQAVGTDQLADSSITPAKITAGAIATNHLANGSITSAKIAAQSVSTGQLADGSVTAPKIANGAIINSAMADNAITAAKIVDGSIVETKLADKAVTAKKIAENAFVVRTASFANLDVPQTPGSIAPIKITVPSQGAVIVTASGSYASIPTPNSPNFTPVNTNFSFLLGLQEGTTSTTPPDDAISIFIAVPNSRISGPFSLTKAFPVLNPGTKTYSLVGAFGSTFGAQGSLFRLTLTAMFVPCSGAVTEQ